MKKILLILFTLFSLSAFSQVEVINVGTVANDGTGDKLRDAMIKINNNRLSIVDSFGNIYREVQVRTLLNDSLDQLRSDATPIEDIFGGLLFDQTKVYNVLDYGAMGDGTTDDTQAFLDMITDAASASLMYIPTGTYRVTGTLTIANHYMFFKGDGIGKTIIKFNPTTDSILFNFIKNAGVDELLYEGLSDMSIQASDQTTQKIAMRFVDCRGVYVDNIVVHTWTSTAKNSIGLLAQGREHYAFNNITFACDKPIVVRENPSGHATIDFGDFHNMYLHNVDISSPHPVVKIESGAGINAVMFSGRQSWASTGGGFYADGCYNIRGLTIENVRWEQSTSGWMIKLNPANESNNVIIRNCWSSSASVAENGIYLDGDIYGVILDNVRTETSDTALYVTSDITGLYIENDWLEGETIVHSYWSQPAIRTIYKKIGIAGETGMDFNFTSVANSTAQNINLGTIIPSKCRVISIDVICKETLAGSGTHDITFRAGNASAGEQFFVSISCDDVNEDVGIIDADKPLALGLSTSASSVWIGADPDANWDTYTGGRWYVYVTYTTNPQWE